MGQVVDTDTAREFMAQTLAQCDAEELAGICAELDDKAAIFSQVLGQRLTAEGLDQLCRNIFAIRPKGRAALGEIDIEQLADWTDELLRGEAAVHERFESYVGKLALPDNVRRAFASELLHFSDPDQYWLWTRWMWDPRTRTGALPLVTTAAYDFGEADPDGVAYLKIGEATAYVHEVGDAAGFQPLTNSLFGTDVFLSCVYVIYAYTVLKMRMTQEFNKVIPGLTEFSRRLLGVYRKQGAPA